MGTSTANNNGVRFPGVNFGQLSHLGDSAKNALSLAKELHEFQDTLKKLKSPPPRGVLEQKLHRILKVARDMGYNLAADNLEHWFEGTGSPRTFDLKPYYGSEIVQITLRKLGVSDNAYWATQGYKKKSLYLPFIKKANIPVGQSKRLADIIGKHDYWEAQTPYYEDHNMDIASQNLNYGLGVFTIRSADKNLGVKHIKDDEYTLEGDTLITANDTYHWTGWKSVDILGLNFSDATLKKLESWGYGKPYKIQSKPIIQPIGPLRITTAHVDY